jgi:hypothetical protein
MKVELRCLACLYRFPSYLGAAALERIQEEGPWDALGDGQTFEDRLHSDFLDQSEACCPQCGHAVEVSEESLSALSHSVLAQW